MSGTGTLSAPRWPRKKPLELTTPDPRFDPAQPLTVNIDPFAPDWIIVGGESGRNARPMDIQWARRLRDQARLFGRVFNFKQVGGRGRDKGGHLLDGREYLGRPSVPEVGNG